MYYNDFFQTVDEAQQRNEIPYGNGTCSYSDGKPTELA